MKVQWKTDNDSSHILFVEIKEEVTKLANRNVKNLLDLGGGTGWYTTRLKKVSPATRMVIMDLDFEWHDNKDLNYVKGNMLALPFKDGAFDAVTAMASLHHVHDGIDKVVESIARVLSDRGILITAEPCANNPIVNFVKHFVITSLHDRSEKPFDPESLIEVINEQFERSEVKYFFYFSYLMPHIAGRLPQGMKRFGIALTRFLYKLDNKILENMPSNRQHAAYIYIKALKNMR